MLVRGTKPINLCVEHRLYGSDASKAEVSRIKEAGGWVSDGRVCGIISVSRAFGDIEFKNGRFQLLEVRH